MRGRWPWVSVPWSQRSFDDIKIVDPMGMDLAVLTSFLSHAHDFYTPDIRAPRYSDNTLLHGHLPLVWKKLQLHVKNVYCTVLECIVDLWHWLAIWFQYLVFWVSAKFPHFLHVLWCKDFNSWESGDTHAWYVVDSIGSESCQICNIYIMYVW